MKYPKLFTKFRVKCETIKHFERILSLDLTIIPEQKEGDIFETTLDTALTLCRKGWVVILGEADRT